ncbi:MAG TPA: amidohydrolase family protein [Actinomycetes bacterium]|nr:amidohydrolase family protein [Actinomycetes bacterium]
MTPTSVVASMPYVETLRLVDHHCHGVLRRPLGRTDFEEMLTEAHSTGGLGGLGGSLFDSQIGFAVRRWCAPVLDLEAGAEPGVYLARRAELGAEEITLRFLRASGLGALCVDTGYVPEPILSPAELGAAAGAPAYEVVRLEAVAEQVARSGTGASGFADAVRSHLAEETRTAVGAKSIAAYRVGLELAGTRPSDAEVADAAGRWLATDTDGSPARLADEVLHRFLVWCGVDLRLPIQFHVGYGDADVDLHRCSPLLLTDLLRALEPTGVPVLLLHNYPFHREAGYLAQVFPSVFIDVSLATHNLGRRAPALLAETLELAPFGKVLFASDAFGLSELYYLGSRLFRRGLTQVLREGLDEDSWTETDAARIARLIGVENACRVYGISPP